MNEMTLNNFNLVGVGLYTAKEAERLTGVPSRSIQRWLYGYRYHHGEIFREMPPVWNGQIPRIDEQLGLGFQDLMEIRFVHAFREHKIGWPTIRIAAQRACDIFKVDHPFSTRRFKTDGRRIFAEAVDESGETKLLDLVRNQYAFHQVVSPSLYIGLEFSDLDSVLRWFPMWPKRDVVVDPHRSFGRPVVASTGVPTEILAKAYEVEESVDCVAKWFDVPTNTVRAAINFESKIAA